MTEKSMTIVDLDYQELATGETKGGSSATIVVSAFAVANGNKVAVAYVRSGAFSGAASFKY